MSGKKLRLARFRATPISGTRRAVIVPIDHGLTMGPLDGIGSTAQIGHWIGSPVIDGIIAHKGIIERLAERGLLSRAGVMIHLNGMSALSPSPNTKERLTDVETAVRLGADGVSIQVNFDGSNDAHNLSTLGRTVDDAGRFGLPVLAMVYDKVPCTDHSSEIARVRHLMRIAVELGVDALKIGAPAELSMIAKVLEDFVADIPVFVAGGALTEPRVLFALARAVTRAGGAGLCVGRNVFQHPNPHALLAELGSVLEAEARENPCALLCDDVPRARLGVTVNAPDDPRPHARVG
jgi:class I fructose-bisphosphate aldolase